MNSSCAAVAFASSLGTAALAGAGAAEGDALALLSQRQAPDAAVRDDAAAPAVAPVPVARFGAQWSWRVNVEADWIGDLQGANEAMARIGASWFFFENVELAGYVTGGYVWQDVENAGTYGLDLELRWHFLAKETWSLFASIGGGVMGSTASVPEGGSEFNFTPSAGLGATFEVADGLRLYLSARWFHVSNAGTFADNPGRDNLSLWAGLSFGL
ncbi:MAG: acyloxyacyl hydrolase [Planctomycetota bacterium]